MRGVRGLRRGLSRVWALPALLAVAIVLAPVAIAAIDAGGGAPEQGIARLTDGVDVPALAAAAPRTAEVEGQVTAALDQRERVPVIVRLREQADVASLAGRARAARAARGRAAQVREVVRELQDTADRAQPAVRPTPAATGCGRGSWSRAGTSSRSGRASSAGGLERSGAVSSEDKIREGAQQFMEDGEEVLAAFVARPRGWTQAMAAV